MADASLRYTLEARDLSSDVLKKAQANLNSFSSKVNSSFKTIAAASATGIAAVYAIQAAWGKVSGFVNESVKAYGEQVQAEAQLQQALGKSSQMLLDQADALQQTTTFSDDAVVGAQAMVAMFIKEENQIKKLMPAIVDMAAAKGMDLKQAADLVTKSIVSETNALKRYGLTIEGAAGSNERAESAVRALESAFKGQAEAIANTPVGKIEQQKNLLNNIQETLGKEIVPMQVEWNKLVLALVEDVLPMINPALHKIATVLNPENMNITEQIKELEGTISRAEQRMAENLQRKLTKEKGGLASIFLGTPEDFNKELDYYRSEIEKAQAKITKLKIPPAQGGDGGDGGGGGALEAEQRKAQEKWDAEQQKHINKERDAEEKRWQDIDKIREDFAKEQQRRHDAEVEEMHTRRAVVIEAEYALEESRINLKTDEYQREIDLLLLKQQKELSEISGNNEAKEILEKTHKNQMLFLTQDHEARKTEEERKGAEDRKKIRQMEEAATWHLVDTSLDAAMTMVDIASREKDELKPIYIALAVMRAASSTIQAVQAAWESSGNNVYVGAALAAAAVIENVALLAGQISAITSAAHGADFITDGPQMMLVGDNPSGREHVKVTPAENNRTFNDSGNVSINLNISGSADRQTIDYSIQQLQSFSKQYKRARYEGMLA
jgi:hypothetical protein